MRPKKRIDLLTGRKAEQAPQVGLMQPPLPVLFRRQGLSCPARNIPPAGVEPLRYVIRNLNVQIHDPFSMPRFHPVGSACRCHVGRHVRPCHDWQRPVARSGVPCKLQPHLRQVSLSCGLAGESGLSLRHPLLHQSSPATLLPGKGQAAQVDTRSRNPGRLLPAAGQRGTARNRSVPCHSSPA